MKIAIAGIAGVAAAWLIPKGGTEPAPSPTPTPPGQLTAAEFPLTMIPDGVSFRAIDGVRVFLVRVGDGVVAFHGISTTEQQGPIFWCQSGHFESTDLDAWYEVTGVARYGMAKRNLDGVRVFVSAGRVTVFPHEFARGSAVTGSLPVLDTAPCPAAQRVG